jgi:hypothetical protein
MAACMTAGTALAADQPLLPFEGYAAFDLDRKAMLRFDDSTGRIPAARIERLLRSGPILGDRLLLKNEVAVYFPDGHIVSSKAEFHTYRPLPGLMPWHVYSRDQIEPNSRYALVEELDRLLGPACAETAYLKGRQRQGGTSYARLRIDRHEVLSLVIDSPGRYDYLTDQTSRSYSVTSALDPYYLGDPGVVGELVAQCRERRGAVKQVRAGER